MVSGSILIIQGKRVEASSLAPAIRQAGYTVQIAHTGSEALAFGKPLLLIFDTRAMRSSGSRTCRSLSDQWGNLPIIHCRAEGIPLDESAAATIYIIEPFTPRKILNRIKKLLPAQDSAEQIHRFGDITLYTGKRTVHVKGIGESSVTPKLISLLLSLMENPNTVVTREQLIEWVWNTTYTGDTRTLDVHIRWLREKIEQNASKPQRLITVRGVGYRLLPDNQATE
jgi:two-component system phosphate regulon response regulator PhoB